MNSIHPVLLAGGDGTRLWPASRRSYPKQFATLVGDESLFQQAARRFGGDGFGAPTVVTNEVYRFVVTAQMAAVGIEPRAVLIEPARRDTGPAVLAAVLGIAATEADALMLVAPSDHAMPDTAEFRAAVGAAAPRARAGDIVTFGIVPEGPETNYGYLRLGAEGAGDGPQDLAGFVEKPCVVTAARMIAEGRHLWNAGIFLMRADVALAAFERHAPTLVGPVRRAVAGARADLGFMRLDPEAWAEVESISIDYAVMERAENLAVMPFGGRWSDLGGWDAVWRIGGADEAGVVAGANATAIDCRDVLLHAEDERMAVVGIGLEDVAVVAMPDAVLVTRKSEGGRVKEAVAALRAAGTPQADVLPRAHRPWGWYESLAAGDRFQVKRIHVHPGAALSLQAHHHRAEHWVVVEGTARVTVDGEARLVTENQSIYVPLGASHRLENPGLVPMILIEVQTGRYLGEDDIVRFEDAYGRGPAPAGAADGRP